MLKLLITDVPYIGHVSLQQCEDKFNDLKKGSKKFNDNRLNLPHDLALQHLVKLAFINIDD